MGFVANTCEQDFALFDAFDLDLTLLAGFQVQGRETFELILLCHDVRCGAECGNVSVFWACKSNGMNEKVSQG